VWTPRRTALLLLVLTAVLYAPTLGYGFVYEDKNDLEAFFRPYDVRDVLVKPARSLTAVSFEVNARLFGRMNPVGYHAGNVALHLLNGALVYGVALAVVADWPAVFASAVFLLHPIQVESVAYVSSRSELVSTACVLLALLAASRGWIVAAVLAVGLAVAGKESAIVAGCLVPLWATWTRAKTPIWSLALWATAIVIGSAYLSGLYGLSLHPLYAGAQIASFGWLLSRVIVPTHLSIDPDLQWSALAASTALGLGIAGVITLLHLPRRSPMAFAALWCVACLLPRLIVPLHEGLHLHHLYLPFVGVVLAIGAQLSTKDGYGIPATLAQA
jgi:hypothetical protein